ncbi:hatching enzyme 1.2-like [Haliotis cracherodii]|uniref:hatching enzyme 1.2-like n=1 Tax=Haliotis cracherodii TaxID=6455 RepID=UPI0039E83190
MWRIAALLCFGYALALPLEKDSEIIEAYPEENAEYFEGDIELRPGDDPRDRNAQRNRNYRWPNGVFPYVIDTNHFSASEQRTINQAMQTLHDKTMVNGKPCITFKKRTNEAAYIHYVGGSGCHTPVGYHHGQSAITLGVGCGRIGTIMHETMHAMGFWHEQSRPDRDSYVTIEWSNIQQGREHNFDKYTTTQVDTLGLQYDYESVMHYNAYSFAVDRRKPTILVKQKGAVIGQRTHLSPFDIKEIQMYYGCLAQHGSVSTPAPATVSPSIAAETCTFSTGFCGWTNPGGDNTNWLRHRGATPSVGTGPTTDHSGSASGYYAYLEASGHYHQKAYLLSKTLPGGDYCLSIYYHMYGHDMGSLKIEAITGGTSRQVIHSMSGDQGNVWKHYLLNIHTTGNFQLEIEGDTGASYRSDIAVDDLTIHNGRCDSFQTGKRDVNDFVEI